jgi:acyl carrier protein
MLRESPSDDEVESVVREIVVEQLAVDAGSVSLSARFEADLGADSLDLIEIVMGLEERFGILLPEDSFCGLSDVADAVKLVLTRWGDAMNERRHASDCL